MTSPEKLSERCGQAIARGDVRDAAVPSAAHIKSIENGARNPKAADVAMLAAVLHPDDDDARREFVSLGTYAAAFDDALPHRRLTLARLLAQIARNVAGHVPAHDRSLLEMRAHLHATLEDRVNALIVETPSTEIREGPVLRLAAITTDGTLVDLEVANDGGERTRELVVLIPGVPRNERAGPSTRATRQRSHHAREISQTRGRSSRNTWTMRRTCTFSA